jgi:hypothetical protein
MAPRSQYSPENLRRLLTVMIPVALVYLALAGFGFYLLLNDQIALALAFIVAAHVATFAFHRWSNKIPRIDDS